MVVARRRAWWPLRGGFGVAVAGSPSFLACDVAGREGPRQQNGPKRPRPGPESQGRRPQRDDPRAKRTAEGGHQRNGERRGAEKGLDTPGPPTGCDGPQSAQTPPRVRSLSKLTSSDLEPR